MSSDLYTFDVPFRTHSSLDMVSSDGITDLCFSDSYQPFPFSSSFFSPPPPPSTHLENQSLYQPNPVQDGPNINNNFGNYSVLEGSRVKSEECQMGVDFPYNSHFLPHSFSGADESASKFMQRSYSCNSFDWKLHGDAFIDSPNFGRHALSSPENSFFTGQIRRACSAGDLQNVKTKHTPQTDSPLLEESNFKVGRYSAEERREKISKYRAKRSQRKFNKTIKYACRKTLADNRTRIRGRFARNDETSEVPRATCSTTAEEHEDNFWVEFVESLNFYGVPQFQE